MSTTQSTYNPLRDGWVITDHLAGRPTRVLASGTTLVLDDHGQIEGPLVCGEVVMVDTEDGPQSGRCRQPVLNNDLACPGHADQIRGWRAQSEAEVVAWERQVEREGEWVR